MARRFSCSPVLGPVSFDVFPTFFSKVAVVRVWGPFFVHCALVRKSVGFFNVFSTSPKLRVSPERCRKNRACVFFAGFIMKNGGLKVRYFCGAALISQSAGKSSTFFCTFFPSLIFLRFRSGGVAKIDFWGFRCGFVVFAKVRFSLGGVLDFALLGKSPRFFGGFLNCGKISISVYWNASFLRFLAGARISREKA